MKRSSKMEKIILEYIMYRLNENNVIEEEKSKLVHVADMILDMYIVENQ
jgi:hypothetical protein